MLETLIIMLVVLWLVGAVTLPAVGALIHLLLVLAIIIIVVRLLRKEPL